MPGGAYPQMRYRFFRGLEWIVKYRWGYFEFLDSSIMIFIIYHNRTCGEKVAHVLCSKRTGLPKAYRNFLLSIRWVLNIIRHVHTIRLYQFLDHVHDGRWIISSASKWSTYGVNTGRTASFTNSNNLDVIDLQCRRFHH